MARLIPPELDQVPGLARGEAARGAAGANWTSSSLGKDRSIFHHDFSGMLLFQPSWGLDVMYTIIYIYIYIIHVLYIYIHIHKICHICVYTKNPIKVVGIANNNHRMILSMRMGI